MLSCKWNEYRAVFAAQKDYWKLWLYRSVDDIWLPVLWVMHRCVIKFVALCEKSGFCIVCCQFYRRLRVGEVVTRFPLLAFGRRLSYVLQVFDYSPCKARPPQKDWEVVLQRGQKTQEENSDYKSSKRCVTVYRQASEIDSEFQLYGISLEESFGHKHYTNYVEVNVLKGFDDCDE